jgi:hypothetical protein
MSILLRHLARILYSTILKAQFKGSSPILLLDIPCDLIDMLPMPFSIINLEFDLRYELETSMLLEVLTELGAFPMEEDPRILLAALRDRREEYGHMTIVGRDINIGDRYERIRIRFGAYEFRDGLHEERTRAIVTVKFHMD